MKKFLLSLLLGWGSVLFGEQISSYDVNMIVQQSGELQLTETIHYDFDSASKHGIFRDIPSTVKGTERVKEIGLYDFSVEMDGKSTEWQQSTISTSDAGELVRLKIGSPSELITGKHTYTIHYKVKRGILPSSQSSSQDAVRWNLIGTGWAVPILRSQADIFLPDSLSRSNPTVSTFVGRYGSTQSGGMPQWVDLGHLHIETALLEPHNGLTVEISYPIGLLDQTGAQMMAVTFLDRLLESWHWPVLFGFLLYLYHFFSNNRGFIDERSIAPRYNAPEGISVLQAGILYDKFTDNEDYSAAVLELAQQGYLEIFQETKEDDPLLKKTDKNTDTLSEDMRYLMNSVLFNGKSSHLLKKNSQTEAETLKNGFETINTILYNWSDSKGFMQNNPQETRKKFLITTLLFMVPVVLLTIYTFSKTFGIDRVVELFVPLVFASVGIIITLSSSAIPLKIFGLGFAAFGILPLFIGLQSGLSLTSLLSSPIMALILMGAAVYYTYRKLGAYTQKGAYTHKHLLGLKEFMSRVKEDEIKRRLQDDPLYLEKAIPYAVLFGITKHWLELYERLGVAQPEWYHGHDTLNHFASSVNSAATSPAASSSGGFSGGGGSSGGGGGGGGGGSW